MKHQKILRLACLTFTPDGKHRAKRLKSAFERRPLAWLHHPISLFHAKSIPPARVDIFEGDLPHSRLAKIFQEYDGILFFCATGTAVRLSAPFFQETAHEPAIVVVDECGRYAISLTAGDIGGDSGLAEMVSAVLGSQAIVTTASDGCGIEAIDLFARKHGLLIENLRHAAHITTLMVEGAAIRLVTEVPARINYPNLVDEHPEACIYVTSQARIDCPLPHCVLRPRNLHVGLSCRGASKDTILHALMQVFEARNLSLNSVRTLAAAESASQEAGLHEACRALQCEARFFDRSALKRPPMNALDTPHLRENMTGLAMCERCACLSGGELFVTKTVSEGVAVAVAKQ